MGTLAFDSLQYARRLRAAGVPEQQAEVQAELMAEAFGFYADNIVTRDYLDATLRAAFAEQDARLDKRFNAIDQRFVELEARFEKRFDAVDGRFAAVNQRFVELEARFEKRFDAVDRRFDAVDQRFVDMEARFEQRFGEHVVHIDMRFQQYVAVMDARFAEQELRFSGQLGEVKTQLRILMLMVSAIWLLVGYPIVQDLLGG